MKTHAQLAADMFAHIGDELQIVAKYEDGAILYANVSPDTETHMTTFIRSKLGGLGEVPIESGRSEDGMTVAWVVHHRMAANLLLLLFSCKQYIDNTTNDDSTLESHYELFSSVTKEN